MNDSSRTRNTTANVASGLVNKVVLLVLSFVSRKIFIEFIGVEYLGINSLFANVLTILSLADMGFGIAMSFSYYKPLADGDKAKLAALVQFYRRVYFLIAAAVGIAGVVLMPFLRLIVDTDIPDSLLYIYYFIALSNTVISYLFVYKSNMVSADQKSYLVNKVQLRVNFVKTVVQVICIVLFKNYIVYASLDVAATLANNIIISRIADKLYPFINDRGIEPLSREARSGIYANLRSVFLYKFASSVMSGTDSIVMSAVVSTVIVGLYSNYLTITNQITSFVQIVFSSFTASIGNMIVENQEDKNYGVFRIMQMVSHIMSGVIAVCLISLMNEFIGLWLGEEYDMGMLMAFAVTANTYFTISLQPIWSYREATGLYNKTKYVMVATAIINLVLSVILGMAIGAPGIVLATVIARIVTYFWYEPYLVYKLYFNHSSAEYYVDYILSIVIITISYVISSLLYSFLPLAGWLGLFVHAFIAVAVSLALYIFRYCRSWEFGMLWEKLRYILKR